MIGFIAVKSLGGYNYVRPDQVMAVAGIEGAKCNLYMSGGVTVPCSEAAKDIVARIEAAMAGDATQDTPLETV
jgi:hypothetical protein